MILESFWDELNIENIEDLHYLSNTQYNTIDQKNMVLEKIDWILRKINSNKNHVKRDYDLKIVSELRYCISTKNNSLTLRGVDYLNYVVESLKDSDF
jgi:thermostable 8-oxoguanine DNA glycosylase